MSALDGVLAGLGVLAASGVAALVSSARARFSQRVAVLGAVLGSALGAASSAVALRSAETLRASVPWAVPGGALTVGLDSLSAFFLIPLFAFAPLSAIHGRAYLAHHEPPGRVGRAGGVLALLIASMGLVLVARNALLFLVAWEAMTLLAYLLISLDHEAPEVQRAGWIYLIASHVGVLALIGLFLALSSLAGGALDFSSLARPDLAEGSLAILLALALVGFGIKGGVVGLHGWLPEAHAAAPSHVSALMSGVLVTLGLYGLLRASEFLTVPRIAGAALMGLGLSGALVGIALALQQRDLKRALAYSTVENLGLVLFAFGLGFWARARGLPALSALGFAGGLLHIWNHCAIKGLLFLGAGNVLSVTGTKDLERLGGLLRRMPYTARAIVLGSAALAGLPPMNGFVGEWLLYRGLAEIAVHSSSGLAIAAALAIVALAVVGGLAALCFVRLVGIALLGQPRSDGARTAREAGPEMAGPLVVLGGACVLLALAAPALGVATAPLVSDLSQTPASGAALHGMLLPLTKFGALVSLASVGVGVFLVRRVRGAPSDDTWGCGYADPRARMQYSASSFAELAMRRIVPTWLRAEGVRPQLGGPFPAGGRLSVRHADPLTRDFYEPVVSRWGERFSRLRFLQQGRLHLYIVYIAGAAVAGLLWATLRSGPTP